VSAPSRESERPYLGARDIDFTSVSMLFQNGMDLTMWYLLLFSLLFINIVCLCYLYLFMIPTFYFIVKVNGGWTSWSSWGECLVTSSGGGEQTRHRSCNNPSPSNGGSYCSGSGDDKRYK
jgi:hypothetical protein